MRYCVLRRHVDPVTLNIVAVNYDVAQVDADAELDPLFLW